MKTKFTKGKWGVTRNGSAVIVEFPIQICLMEKSNPQSLHNALLISKAPLLFSDLLDIVWLVEKGATYEEVQERIKTSKQLLKEATEL